MSGLKKRAESVEKIETPLGDEIRLGDWYWYNETTSKGTKRWFCHVNHLGSNYVNIDAPDGSSWRIHLDEFADVCTHEPDAERVISDKVREYVENIRESINKIRGLDEKLCLTTKGGQQESSTALTVFNGIDETKDYQLRLKQVKSELIPAEKENIKHQTRYMECWLSARALPLIAESDRVDSILEKIDSRLTDLSIYAGLEENVAQIRRGRHAPASEPIHLLQRTHYMDEEYLARYTVGGMEFRSIDAFDEWVARDENLTRLLPFPRCVLAFRVRRYAKERYATDLTSFFVNIRLEEMDKWTFLYVRNGDALYRAASEHEFGEHLFPGKDVLDFSEPMVGSFDGDECKSFITAREYEEVLKEREEKEKQEAFYALAHKGWMRRERRKRKHRGKTLFSHDSPFYRRMGGWSYSGRDRGSYHPFDQGSVYYDDMVAKVDSMVRDYNRVSLLMQGLLDRTEVFLPHPGVRMWDTASVEANVKLIYDDSMTLYDGEAPDFEAYKLEIGRGIKAGTMTIGQADVWDRLRKAEREDRDKYDRKALKYSGKGPDIVAEVQSVRGGVAFFKWRAKSNYFYDKDVTRVLKVPVFQLFNVDLYTPGKFKEFFNDPRTRRGYLKWGPPMLYAEEWHAKTMTSDGKRYNEILDGINWHEDDD